MSSVAAMMSMPMAMMTSSAKVPVAMMPMSSHEMTVSIAQMNMSAHDGLPIDVAKIAKI